MNLKDILEEMNYLNDIMLELIDELTNYEKGSLDDLPSTFAEDQRYNVQRIQILYENIKRHIITLEKKAQS